MAHCPNCGLSAIRTRDWACQWCGYPLVSGMYGKTSKTFAELKQERDGGAISMALLVETEPTIEPETNQVSEPEAEAVTEPKTIQVVEPEVELTHETETVQVVEPEVEHTSEPETAQVVESESEPIPEPEKYQTEETEAAIEPESVKTEEPEADVAGETQPIPEVTVAELCSSYQDYGMAGHEEFKNSVFRVRGIVDSIVTKDVVEQYRVALTDQEPHPLGDIYCKFEKKDAPTISKLTVGQPLTVQGRYDGFVTNIVLTDCVLVN